MCVRIEHYYEHDPELQAPPNSTEVALPCHIGSHQFLPLPHAQHRAKEFTAAVEHYTLALGQKPNNAPLHSNRAAAYMKLSLWAEAEQDCTYALDLDPRNVKALLRRSTARLELKDGTGALADAEFALEADGQNSPELQAAEAKARKLLGRDGRKKKIIIEECSDEDEDVADDTSAGGAASDQRIGRDSSSSELASASPQAESSVIVQAVAPTRTRIPVVVVADSASSGSSLEGDGSAGSGEEEVEEEFFDAHTGLASSEGGSGNAQVTSGSSGDGVSAESGSGDFDTTLLPHNGSDTAWGSGGVSPTHGSQEGSMMAGPLDADVPAPVPAAAQRHQLVEAAATAAAAAAAAAAQRRAAATAAVAAAAGAAAALAAYGPVPTVPSSTPPAQESLEAAAAALKEEGNVHFKQANYLQASYKYRDAIELKPDNPALYNNRSFARLNMNNAQGAFEDAAVAVALEGGSVSKTFLRRANAKLQLGDLEVGCSRLFYSHCEGYMWLLDCHHLIDGS